MINVNIWWSKICEFQWRIFTWYIIPQNDIFRTHHFRAKEVFGWIRPMICMIPLPHEKKIVGLMGRMVNV